jgi:basic membrane protein A
MRRRAFLSLFAAAVLAASAVAPAGAAPPTKVGVAYDIAGLGEDPFNGLVQAGALQAEADLGIKLFESEQVRKNGTVLEPATVLAKLSKKSHLVIAVGFLYGDVVEDIAVANPGTNYAAIDWGSATPPDNLLGAGTAVNEGSFLVGAAAALESRSGAVGYIGGMAFPLSQQFEAGYVAGVRQINPTAVIEVAYVNTFSDPVVVYENAMAMYVSGVDVIYHAAGGAGFGLFEAARDFSAAFGEHVWAIGVDFDQYQQAPDDIKPHIFTSMTKNVDVVTYDIIKSQVDGTFIGGFEVWGLSRNGVGYATSGGFVDPYVAQLEELRAAIIDGTIIVPIVP